MTVVEVEMTNLGRRFDEHQESSVTLHKDALGLMNDLDKRADKQDIALARLMAGVAVALFAANLLAPLILKALGVQP